MEILSVIFGTIYASFAMLVCEGCGRRKGEGE